MFLVRTESLIELLTQFLDETMIESKSSAGPEVLPRFRKYSILAALVLVCFLVRLPLILHPPRGFYYNIDELDQTLAAVNRFLGLPGTLLMKPGTFLEFFYVPLFLGDMVTRGGLALAPGTFLGELSSRLTATYSDPRHAVMLMRYLVAIITSAAPLLAALIVDALSNSKITAFLAALLILLDPSFFRNCLMAVDESVAVTLALGSLLCLLKTRPGGRFEYSGFLLAAALASRITFASFAVLPIVYLLIQSELGPWNQRVKSLARFGVGLSGGLIFWFPYLWTEPMRTAKSLYGCFNKPGAHFEIHALVEGWQQANGVGFSLAWLLVLGVGAYVVYRWRHPLGVGALAATLVIVAPIALRATRVMPWYFLPLLPCWVALLGVVASRPLEAPLSHRAIRGSFLALLALATGLSCYEDVTREVRARLPGSLDAALEVMSSLPADTEIYLPEELLRDPRLPLSHATCERIRTRLEGMLQDSSGLIRFAGDYGIPPQAAQVLRTDFNEKEFTQAAQMAISCRVAPLETRGVFYYNHPTEFAIARSLADMSFEEAARAVRTSPRAAILVADREVTLGTPFWSGQGEWYWYGKR